MILPHQAEQNIRRQATEILLLHKRKYSNEDLLIIEVAQLRIEVEKLKKELEKKN